MEKGFHQTTMRDVAEACDMSPGALYRYVGSKGDILYLLLSRGADIDKEICNTNLDAANDIGWTEIMRGLLRKHMQIVHDAQDLFIFNYTEMRNLPRDYRHGLLEGAARVVAFYEKLLLRGVEAGEFEVEEPNVVAHNITVLCHAWAIRRWYLRKRYTLEEYIKKQTDYILKAIRGNPHRLAGSREDTGQRASTAIKIKQSS